MDEWISKKDLLIKTGISYGQLYRWKRENLIPDSWFVKRSTFTGQETFLPQERTLERIRFILENKDQYSLQQLLKLLSPDSESRTYPTELLIKIPFATRPIIQMTALTNTESFNHGQALCIMICARILTENDLSDAALIATLHALLTWQSERQILEEADGRFVLIQVSNEILPLYIHPDSQISVPEGARIIFELSFSDLPDQYTQELNKLFEGDE